MAGIIAEKLIHTLSIFTQEVQMMFSSVFYVLVANVVLLFIRKQTTFPMSPLLVDICAGICFTWGNSKKTSLSFIYGSLGIFSFFFLIDVLLLVYRLHMLKEYEEIMVPEGARQDATVRTILSDQMVEK